jgi:hypothetical protein
VDLSIPLDTGAVNMGDDFSLDFSDYGSGLDTSTDWLTGGGMTIDPGSFGSDTGSVWSGGSDYLGDVWGGGGFDLGSGAVDDFWGGQDFVLTDSGAILDAATGAAVDTSVANVLDNLTNLAVNALKVYGVWQQYNKQPIAAPGTRQLSNGATVTPVKNGTLVTRGPTGSTSTRPMEPGKPYTFADGSIVINNGNGTYTVISANGQSTTQPYPQGTPTGGLSSMLGGSNMGPLLVGGGLLLGGLLLARRRR